jgi:DNA-directed RNA polymerase specialized sigma24 family protein
MLECNPVPMYTRENKDRLIDLAKRHSSDELLLVMLAGLTKPQLEVMLLTFSLDLTHREAAAVLGRSESAVLKSARQGLAKAERNILNDKARTRDKKRGGG